MVTHERKNAGNETKVEAIERLLSNNKRLGVGYILVRKPCGRTFQKKHSLLELSKLHFIKENTLSLTVFYLQGSSTSYAKLTINFRKTKHVWDI